MALLQLRYFSPALTCQEEVVVLLPERNGQFSGDTTSPYQTLYLLHGLGDDAMGWLRRTEVDSLVRDTDVAVVMPSVGHSFYTNMARGQRYWDFVSEELPRYLASMLPLSTRREDTFVCGNSMGGYGAFKLALSHPERFCRAAALSGALDVASFVRNQSFPGFDPRAAFGDELDVAGTPNDLLQLVDDAARSATSLPDLLAICGRSDILVDESRAFVRHVRERGIGIDYREREGEHLWTSWQKWLPEVFAWLTR